MQAHRAHLGPAAVYVARTGIDQLTSARSLGVRPSSFGADAWPSGKGCEQHELFQSVDDVDKIVLLERWTSQASLDMRMEAEHTRDRSLIDALVALWAPGTTPTIERFEV